VPYSKVVIKKPRVVYKDLSEDFVVGYALEDEYEAQIDPKQSDKELMLTGVHELFHLILPDLTERQIIKLEKTSGRAIWNMAMRLKRKWKKEWETKNLQK
jgi:hypothetical protein